MNCHPALTLNIMTHMTHSTRFIVFLVFASSTAAFGQHTLHEQFGEITGSIDAIVGVDAVVIETGDTASFNAGRHYPMQSTYKFPIAMAVLDNVDKGKLGLEQKIHLRPSDMVGHTHSPIRDKYPKGNVDLPLSEIVQLTVGESDNIGCDVLLRTLGGPAKAEKYIHSLGVMEMAIATTERGQQVADQSVQYKNWATPAAMTKLLKLLLTGKVLSEKSTALLMTFMTQSTPGKNRLKGLLPAGTIVAHKTGTAGTVDGMTSATNDAGIITLPNGNHLAITVFVADSHASEADREMTIAKIARAAWDHWTK